MVEVNAGRGLIRQSITFRVFVSSTFSDVKVERNALQERVFPKLREVCMQHGARFQAIDLRLGVSEEAALDHQTMNLCLSEIRRCQRVTPRPNFIVLLGDRYGWRPLPPQVPAQEFEQLRERIADRDALALLDRWYRRDDNAVPAEYCLRPREVAVAEDATEANVEAAREREAAQWQDTEQRLGDILLRALRELAWPDDDARGVKYECSATEQEILGGALKAGTDHAFCYFRAIENLPHDQSVIGFIDLYGQGSPDQEAEECLTDLKTQLRGHFPEDHIYDYNAEWCGGGLTDDHLEALCERVLADLSQVILEEIDKLEVVEELDEEVENHCEFGQERARHFIGRDDIPAIIRDYVAHGSAHPLVVHGVSGSGATLPP